MTAAGLRLRLPALLPAIAGALALWGCTHDPRFTAQTDVPAQARQGRAYVALDVYEYDDGAFGPAHNHHAQATFTNVALGKNPLYFPVDDWAQFRVTKPDHPDHIYPIEAGTYRLTVLSVPGATNVPLGLFALARSPVEFTVRPGELVYLGSLAWRDVKTSSILQFQPKYRLEFDLADELAAHRAALEQEAAALPGAPVMQTRLMTVKALAIDVQGHRPSLW